MAQHRFEYVLELKNFKQPVVPGLSIETTWRNPSIGDRQILAELMLDSYRDTIDYDGETIDNALREVESYFLSLQDDSTWLDRSWLGFVEDSLACACW